MERCLMLSNCLQSPYQQTLLKVRSTLFVKCGVQIWLSKKLFHYYRSLAIMCCNFWKFGYRLYQRKSIKFWAWHELKWSGAILALSYHGKDHFSQLVRNILRHLKLLNLLAAIHHVNRSLMEISSFVCFFSRGVHSHTTMMLFYTNVYNHAKFYCNCFLKQKNACKEELTAEFGDILIEIWGFYYNLVYHVECLEICWFRWVYQSIHFKALTDDKFNLVNQKSYCDETHLIISDWQ